MATTVHRQHRCAPPDVYGSSHGPGDVWQCTCGDYYVATVWGAYEAPYRWKPTSAWRAELTLRKAQS